METSLAHPPKNTFSRTMLPELYLFPDDAPPPSASPSSRRLSLTRGPNRGLTRLLDEGISMLTDSGLAHASAKGNVG